MNEGLREDSVAICQSQQWLAVGLMHHKGLVLCRNTTLVQ